MNLKEIGCKGGEGDKNILGLYSMAVLATFKPTGCRSYETSLISKNEAITLSY
jgi:hypothetical protein